MTAEEQHALGGEVPLDTAELAQPRYPIGRGVFRCCKARLVDAFTIERTYVWIWRDADGGDERPDEHLFVKVEPIDRSARDTSWMADHLDWPPELEAAAR